MLSILDITRLLRPEFPTLETWHVKNLAARGLIEEPGRAGGSRIFSEADLPKIVAALRKHGFNRRGRKAVEI